MLGTSIRASIMKGGHADINDDETKIMFVTRTVKSLAVTNIYELETGELIDNNLSHIPAYQKYWTRYRILFKYTHTRVNIWT